MEISMDIRLFVHGAIEDTETKNPWRIKIDR